MAGLERYRRAARFDAGQPNMMPAQAMQARAATFQQFANRAHDARDEEVRAEKAKRLLQEGVEASLREEEFRNELQTLAEQHSNDPDAFDFAAKQAASDLVRPMRSGEIKAKLGVSLAKLRGATYRQIRGQAIEASLRNGLKLFEHRTGRLVESALLAARGGDGKAFGDAEAELREHIQQARAAGLLGEAEQMDLEARYNAQVEAQAYLARFDMARRSGMPEVFIDQFRKQPPEDLSLEQRAAIEKEMLSTLATDKRLESWQNEKARAEGALEMERAASNLAIRVDRGQASEREIDEAFELGLISGSTRASMYRSLDKQGEALRAAADRAELIRRAADGEAVLDPRNKEHVQAVDDAHAALGGGLDATLNLARRTGILPSATRAALRIGARTGPGEEAVELYSALQDQAPQALADMPEKDVAVLDTAADLARGGLPLPQAIERAREAANREPAEQQIIEQRLRVELKDAPNDEALQDALNSDNEFDTEWLSGAPKPPPAMAADFERLVQTHYSVGGDLEQAQSAAFKALKRSWSRSDINGKGQIMRYAPERDLGLPADRLREALDEELAAMGEDPKRVVIVSDNETARGSRGNRTYSLQRLRDDGLTEIIFDEQNMPRRYYWNVEAIVKAERDKRMGIAKRNRAASEIEQPAPVRHFEGM